MAQMVKRLPAMWETQVWSLGWKDPLEKEMATHFIILAWRIPWMEEPGRYSPWGRTHIVVHSLCPVSGCYSVSSMSPCEALPLPITRWGASGKSGWSSLKFLLPEPGLTWGLEQPPSDSLRCACSLPNVLERSLLRRDSRNHWPP